MKADPLHFSDVCYPHFYYCSPLGGWQNYGLFKMESSFIMTLTSKHALFHYSIKWFYSNKWETKWMTFYPFGKIKTPTDEGKHFAKWILTSLITLFQSWPYLASLQVRLRTKGRAKERSLKSVRWPFNEDHFFYGSLFVSHPGQVLLLSSLNHKLVVAVSKMCRELL